MNTTVIRDRVVNAVVRPRFYAWVALALCGFVVIGFARTYYLRSLSSLPPLGGLLHLHGVVFTAWLAVFIAQTRLVAAGRVDLHRRLGLASIALAVLVIVLGVATAVDAGIRTPIRRSGLTGAQGTLVPLTSIALFTVFVSAALWFRRRAALHKRLMVLASIIIVAPALARISRWPIFGGEDSPFIRVVLLALLLAVIAHDLVRERRVHKATIYGVGTIVAATIVLQLIARSELGRSVVRALE